MSEKAAVLANPFDAAALDEDTELTALANALRLADGFRLFFVRCNQPNQRWRLIDKLGLHFPQDTFFGIHFTEPVPHLLDALRERLPESPPRALFVTGLEYSLPVADEAENTSFTANLNASRNSFPAAIPCPLVLWLPEYALTAIVRGAPDFCSIRSGVYFFAASPEERSPIFEAVNSGNDWQLASLPLLEKQERIATINSLLQDYQALSPDQREYRAESRLLDRSGHLHMELGHWKLAEQAYQQSLMIRGTLGDRYGEEVTLSNLANVYQHQGRWAEAEQKYQQSLMIRETLCDRHGEGATLSNLGIVYGSQGRWREAEQVYGKSLEICRQLGDQHGEGTVLGNLGNVYGSQGRWREAEQVYGKSLEICRQLGDQYGEGVALSNLGIVYQSQGRWREAEQVYGKSLEICRQLGDQNGEGTTLSNLAFLKEAEGSLNKAIEFGQAAVDVLMMTEDTALLKKTRGWVEEWERQAQNLSRPFAPVSGD